MNSIKVSVIIPTFNEAHVIKNCIESLLKQTLRSFEIIIIDDGSTDATPDVVANLASKYKAFLTMLRQKHKGPGEARNLGAKQARGKILVFVDADMTFDKEFLAVLTRPLIKGESKGTFSKEEFVSNWSNVWSRCWNYNQGWEEKRRHNKNYPDTQKVFRAILKSEFDRVGGFEKGGHYTDDYLSDKLGYEAKTVPGAVFYHANPETLQEAFIQAKWAAKREYKFGKYGIIYSMFRSCLPVSIIVGFVKSIMNFEPRFLFFKLGYDLGAFIGLLEILFSDKHGK